MLFRPQSILFALVALVATTGLASPIQEDVGLESRASNVLIGFRSVPKSDADQYNKDKTINGKPGGNSGQIGQGIYLSQGPHDWPGPYLCTVYADSTKFKNAHKLWIPEKSEIDKKTLWYQPANTDAYIQQYKLTPASTIRFSPISGKPGAIQMVIPPALLGSSPLGITVHCEATPTSPGKFPASLNYPSLSRDWAIGGVKP